MQKTVRLTHSHLGLLAQLDHTALEQESHGRAVHGEHHQMSGRGVREVLADQRQCTGVLHFVSCGQLSAKHVQHTMKNLGFPPKIACDGTHRSTHRSKKQSKSEKKKHSTDGNNRESMKSIIATASTVKLHRSMPSVGALRTAHASDKRRPVDMGSSCCFGCAAKSFDETVEVP